MIMQALATFRNVKKAILDGYAMGYPPFLLERGDNPEKTGWCINGGLPFFIILQFNYIYCMCVGKVKFPLLRFHSSIFWVNQTRFLSKSL